MRTPPEPPIDTSGLAHQLGLAPHPEGGWFRRTWSSPRTLPDGRALASSIFYLLNDGEVSRWHRLLDADELWHHVAGDPVELRVSGNGRDEYVAVLGSDVRADQAPQLVVASQDWQSARSLGAWSLVACTVTPEFTFDAYELAPDGWSPGAPA